MRVESPARPSVRVGAPADRGRRPRRAGAPRRARELHPLAWWIWAVALATAASRTTNPLLLMAVMAAAGYVVARRRTEAPWARAFRYYLVLGLGVVAIRVVFRALLGAGDGPDAHRLFTVIRIPLPGWAAGIELGGPVTLEGVLGASYDGLRLATLLVCIGAANALANPKRALRVLPGALYEVGVAVVISVTVAPQLIESAQRIRRARRLRGGGPGRPRAWRAVRSIAIPVLEDALDRSLSLAAAMDCRGYGRRAGATVRARRATAVLLLGGLLALCFGAYGLLDGTATAGFALPSVVIGTGLSASALALGSRRVGHTACRPDPWRRPEWLVTAGGVAAAAAFVIAARTDALDLNPSVLPLSWPALPLLPLAGVLVAASAGVAAPPVPVARTARSREVAPLRRPGRARRTVDG